MKAHYLWVGVWNSVFPAENRREIVRIVAKQIGEWEARYGEHRGVAYRAYRKSDGGVVIHQYEWDTRVDGDHRAALFEFDSLDDAANAGFRQALENMLRR